MYKIYQGTVARGFQFASGQGVSRANCPSPFSAGTLALQMPHFRARGFDLEQEVPSFFGGTINVEIGTELILNRPDKTLPNIAWTTPQCAVQIAPETFSFIRACLIYQDRYHSGLLYYPHPETKPDDVNGHRYDVLEFLTHHVEGLTYDTPAHIVCRADAFEARPASGSLVTPSVIS